MYLNKFLKFQNIGSDILWLVKLEFFLFDSDKTDLTNVEF